MAPTWRASCPASACNHDRPRRPAPRRRHPSQTSDNAELTAIFDADRSAREGKLTAEDWKGLREKDAARRARVRALIAAGRVATGTDLYHAAFVFQHGYDPDDYLFAHSLAVTAVAEGRRDARWIAAATLDRYRQAIGRAQVYGTQYRWSEVEPVSQAPYDQALVSDALRASLGVPPLAAQQVRARDLEAERRPR